MLSASAALPRCITLEDWKNGSGGDGEGRGGDDEKAKDRWLAFHFFIFSASSKEGTKIACGDNGLMMVRWVSKRAEG